MKEVTKTQLCAMVIKKIKGASHYSHVNAVMTLLFEEMFKDFIDGKEFKIVNFGKFKLEMPRKVRYLNYTSKTVSETLTRRFFTFKMNTYFKYYLNQSLDLQKTFGVERETLNRNCKKVLEATKDSNDQE